MTPGEIVAFWKNVGEKRWFAIDPALDTEIRHRFEQAWQQARDGKLADWEQTKDGALALLILLDQFPRNMFRGTAEAFSSDAQARGVAERAVARGDDLKSPAALRVFFYLPFMHSEHEPDQDRCVALIAERLGGKKPELPFCSRSPGGHPQVRPISRAQRSPQPFQHAGRERVPAIAAAGHATVAERHCRFMHFLRRSGSGRWL